MAYGDVPVRDSTSVDNSTKENQNIAILGEHTDTNVYNVADILDGTTSSPLGSAGSITFLGTWQAPLILGSYRIWHDATNDVFRTKSSAPTTEIDGYIIMESD